MGRGPAWWTRPLHVSALPIFPGRRQPSIFGADELNFCVRDGNRWTLIAINTDSIFSPVCPAFAAHPEVPTIILTDVSAKIKGSRKGNW